MLVAASLPAGSAAPTGARSFLCRLIIFSAPCPRSSSPLLVSARARSGRTGAPSGARRPAGGRGAVGAREYSGGDPLPATPTQETGHPCT